MWAVDQQRRRPAEVASNDRTEAAGAWDDSDSPIPVTSRDATWGKRDAPVTIVEYGDFRSSLCADAEVELAQVRATYGADKVRIIWKNYVARGDARARSVAEAAQGIFALEGPDAFWAFHDAALDNRDSPSDEWFRASANIAGVKDLDAYEAGLHGHTWADKVDKDTADGNALNVQWAPAFIVNGVEIDGPQPFLLFKGLIDRELAKAQAKIAAGTPKARVYVEITKERKKTDDNLASRPTDGQDTKTVFNIAVGPSPALGPTSAPVTILEFGEFQSRFSARAEKTLGALRAKYGEQIRLVWKNAGLPDRPAAEPAAEAAAEVRAEKGDTAFWEVHDELLAHRTESHGRVGPEPRPHRETCE